MPELQKDVRRCTGAVRFDWGRQNLGPSGSSKDHGADVPMARQLEMNTKDAEGIIEFIWCLYKYKYTEEHIFIFILFYIYIYERERKIWPGPKFIYIYIHKTEIL